MAEAFAEVSSGVSIYKKLLLTSGIGQNKGFLYMINRVLSEEELRC